MADYCNISMFEVQEMHAINYYFYLRESFIFTKMKTEEGREYLRNAHRLTVTAPDRKNLKKTFGKK